MTTLDLSHSGADLSIRFAGALSHLAAAWRRHRLYRQTVRELGNLGDRELADVGLNRGSIRDVARQAADATAG